MSCRMSRQYTAYLQRYAGVYADSTHKELNRRYARLTRTLRAFGVNNYATLDAEHVKELALFLRDRKITAKAVLHDLTSLGNLCKFYNCDAVERARALYPALFYSPRQSRLPPLKTHDLNAILHACHHLAHSDDYIDVRSAGAVALCVGAGLRTIELQHVRADDVDLSARTVRVDVVKGGDTYGEPRTIPIIPPTIATISRFLAVRKKQPPTVSQSQYILANSQTGDTLSTNTLRKDKKQVEKLAGFNFDFRILRRTYAQILIDNGAPLSAVSVVMGHLSTLTTEQAYARIRPDSAIEQIQGVF